MDWIVIGSFICLSPLDFDYFIGAVNIYNEQRTKMLVFALLWKLFNYLIMYFHVCSRCHSENLTWITKVFNDDSE